MPDSNQTLVMKFGGTSVGSVDALTKATQIIKDAHDGISTRGGDHFRDVWCDRSIVEVLPRLPRRETLIRFQMQNPC